MALLDRPPARLCLIDGLFDSCPAPWHKEFLLLMARGTVVFGAASMGALRAAELGRFGMIGIGVIFEAFRRGRLHGDDEVALVHATSELDWTPLSVPMVELRATLVAACRAGVIEPAVARRVRTRVHDIHFSDRDWPMMEKVCRAEGFLGRDAFRALQAMHVPLKRHDALACLASAVSWYGPPVVPEPPPATCFIQALASELRSRPPAHNRERRPRRPGNALPSPLAAGDGT